MGIEVNDNAELRELLSKAVKRLEHIVGCDMHFFHPDAMSCDGKTSMGECRHKRTCELIFESRKALAKPQRNCTDNNQVPGVPSVPEVPSVPSTIARLRTVLEDLFAKGCVSRHDRVAVCPPCIDNEGYSPSNEWCAGCSSDVKEKCMAIYNARAALKESEDS